MAEKRTPPADDRDALIQQQKDEEATDVRRETASAYLRTAGVAVRARGGRATQWPPKSGHHDGGVHRLGAGAVAAATPSRAARECV